MRYAIYLAPAADTALWRFGSRVIGYDAASGERLGPPQVPGGADRPYPAAAWDAWTAEPRRYGFHGTLKAPFTLRPGVRETDLIDASKTFAASRTPTRISKLEVSLVGNFVALIPDAPAPALDALANACVQHFEPFRAPLSEADVARRKARPLTERQTAYLEAWGYPYVFEDFRFHMTLTGALPADVQAEVCALLDARYAAVEPGLDLDAIAVFRQDDRAGPFRAIARLPFGGGAWFHV